MLLVACSLPAFCTAKQRQLQVFVEICLSISAAGSCRMQLQRSLKRPVPSLLLTGRTWPTSSSRQGCGCTPLLSFLDAVCLMRNH